MRNGNDKMWTLYREGAVDQSLHGLRQSPFCCFSAFGSTSCSDHAYNLPLRQGHHPLGSHTIAFRAMCKADV